MSTAARSLSPIPAPRASASLPRITYLDVAGSAGSVPLLLLHGVGSSSETWSDLLPLIGGRRIVAPDYRGHGASEAPPPPYAMDDFVADAFRLLDELGIGTVDVAGFSIGALFAERMALLAPARVRSLILLASIAGRSPAEKERSEARLAFIAATPPAVTAAGSAQRWFTPGFLRARPDLVRRETDIVAGMAPEPYAASYKVLVENDLIEEVAAIACPALIMTGELDEGSTPAMSRALHERIRGSRLVIVPGVKHYLHVERPQTVAAEINAFLAAHHPNPPPADGRGA